MKLLVGLKKVYLNLTLTRVVFESASTIYKKRYNANLTLTRVVFESS